MIEGLEKARDFYFATLHDIEICIQDSVETDPELEKANDRWAKINQGLLYSTEERLEIPPR
jgi:hypothetical protein